MRSNMYLLMGAKGQRETRRITLRTVADETGIAYYTVHAIATEKIKEYPKDVLATLCTYFGVGIGDLLALADVPDAAVEQGVQ